MQSFALQHKYHKCYGSKISRSLSCIVLPPKDNLVSSHLIIWLWFSGLHLCLKTSYALRDVLQEECCSYVVHMLGIESLWELSNFQNWSTLQWDLWNGWSVGSEQGSVSRGVDGSLKNLVCKKKTKTENFPLLLSLAKLHQLATLSLYKMSHWMP